MTGPPEIAYDDFNRLESCVTDQFGPWGEEAIVTQEVIDSFADLSGDRQWIHTDVERSKTESPFGTTIAHGFLLLALLPRLRSESVKIVGHASALNYGSDKLRFLAPVPAGARIHARSRLADLEARQSGTLVTTEIEVSVVGAERPSLLYRMQVLYRGRAGS
ncbi:MAG TPA: MaoC/PaaZ C-terminal domain-containing protein [Acidimicrobiales bacterium]|nr:MaoC/PaaZ C-terminal domain-containing protein [Acidimicrobiales bacterium]